MEKNLPSNAGSSGWPGNPDRTKRTVQRDHSLNRRGMLTSVSRQFWLSRECRASLQKDNKRGSRRTSSSLVEHNSPASAVSCDGPWRAGWTKRKRTGEVWERASSPLWKTTYERERWSEIDGGYWLDIQWGKTEFNCRELIDGGYDDWYLTHLENVFVVRFADVCEDSESMRMENNVAVSFGHVVAGWRYVLVPGETVTKNRRSYHHAHG